MKSLLLLLFFPLFLSAQDWVIVNDSVSYYDVYTGEIITGGDFYKLDSINHDETQITYKKLIEYLTWCENQKKFTGWKVFLKDYNNGDDQIIFVPKLGFKGVPTKITLKNPRVFYVKEVYKKTEPTLKEFEEWLKK